MFNKIVFVLVTIIVVAVVILFLTISMPAIKSMTDVAANDATTGNYAGYHEAAAAAPIIFYALPLLVGGIAIFLRLRQPDE